MKEKKTEDVIKKKNRAKYSSYFPHFHHDTSSETDYIVLNSDW